MGRTEPGFLPRRSSSGGVRSRKKPGLENENSQRKLLAYLTGEEVDDRILMAFDASSDKLIWRKAMRRFGRTSSMR